MNCTIDGCNKTARCKGLCNRHYHKQWVRQKQVKPCSMKGCDTPIRSKELCSYHYMRSYNNSRERNQVRYIGECTIESCQKPQKTRGWCDMHYKRWQKHGDPLKVAISYRPPNPNVPTTKYKREYTTYIAMKSRCYNPNDPRYDRYGGRGIIVCDRWKESFQNFLDDVGTRPTPKHTIDRINNDGNYEPSNVKWSTVREQNVNRSNSRKISGVGSFIDHTGTKRWYSTLKIGKTWVYRKWFSSEQEAIEARRDAERIYLNNVI